MDMAGPDGVVSCGGYEIVYVGGTILGEYMYDRLSFWREAMSVILCVLGRDIRNQGGVAERFSLEIERLLNSDWSGRSLSVEVVLQEYLSCDFVNEFGYYRPRSEIKKIIRVLVGDGGSVSGFFYVRRKSHVATLREISAVKIAGCLEFEHDVDCLEIPLVLKFVVLMKFFDWWEPRFCCCLTSEPIITCCSTCFIQRAFDCCSECKRYIKYDGRYDVLVPES